MGLFLAQGVSVPNLREELDRLHEYAEVADIGDIARRYFAMNSFDGILTILGVLVGNYLAEVRNSAVIITTGMATSISMGISGLWGAYLTESAERQRSLDDLEEYTLSDLSDTRIGRASRVAVIVVAVVDGLAPLLASSLVLAPFLLTGAWGDVLYSYALALVSAMASLFGLGAYLGRISKKNVIVSGSRMIVAGLLSLALSFLLERVYH
jgi:predicted membrane protein (TIGR00267 family)